MSARVLGVAAAPTGTAMTKLPDNIVQAATRLRRLIEQADTPDLRETARRDLERLIQQHLHCAGQLNADSPPAGPRNSNVLSKCCARSLRKRTFFGSNQRARAFMRRHLNCGSATTSPEFVPYNHRGNCDAHCAHRPEPTH